eukprot:Opistho-1_new@59207
MRHGQPSPMEEVVQTAATCAGLGAVYGTIVMALTLKPQLKEQRVSALMNVARTVSQNTVFFALVGTSYAVGKTASQTFLFHGEDTAATSGFGGAAAGAFLGFRQSSLKTGIWGALLIGAMSYAATRLGQDTQTGNARVSEYLRVLKQKEGSKDDHH